ncbi:MAG: type restriction enzyme subunit, partial [Desulfonauticus sp.]|nr:type restriction enzyme subunit [Desulfonauticus sp.]
SEDKIDKWFEVKTKGLSDIAKAQLKKRWGTLKKLYSSQSRMEKIVADIIFDFETKPRLATGRGNAMLVAGSIYEACKYYELFRSKGFDKVAIITSYRPSITSIKGEETGEEGEAENIRKYEVYRKMIADFFNISEDEAVKDYWIDKFEKEVKKKFIEEPGQMKLLIVVDRLLTGFDAPSATYLYIDKKMRDHGLFQAICRVNRLDDKDKDDDLTKEYGYIIDYQDLFNSLESAIKDYTSGAFAEFDQVDVDGLLKDRIMEAKKKLDEALEKIELLTEGVPFPKSINEYGEYFIGDNSEEKQQLRVEFYKSVSSLVRAYTNIANELDEAGYSEKEQEEIKEKVKKYTAIRDSLKLMSGDYVDFKLFDPAMRYLIDSYIQAEESRVLASFEDRSLLELIALDGIKNTIENLPKEIGRNKEAIAETIENNIRKLLIDKREVNPAYYDNMSKILKILIEQRKKEVINYEEYLRQIEKLTKQLINMEDNAEQYPSSIRSSMAKRAIYDNLKGIIFSIEEVTNKIDEAIRMVKKDDWRGNKIKERQIKYTIAKVLNELSPLGVKEKSEKYGYDDRESESLVDKIFKIVKKQEEY